MVNTAAVQNARSASPSPKGSSQRETNCAGSTEFKDLLDLAGQHAKMTDADSAVAESPAAGGGDPMTGGQGVKEPGTQPQEQDDSVPNVSGERLHMQNIPLYMEMQNPMDGIDPALLSVMWKTDTPKNLEALTNVENQGPAGSGHCAGETPVTGQGSEQESPQLMESQSVAEPVSAEMISQADGGESKEARQYWGVNDQTAESAQTEAVHANDPKAVHPEQGKVLDVKPETIAGTDRQTEDVKQLMAAEAGQQTERDESGLQAEQQSTGAVESDRAGEESSLAAQGKVNSGTPDDAKSYIEEKNPQQRAGEGIQPDSAAVAQQDRQRANVLGETDRKSPVHTTVQVKVREPEELPKAVLDQLVQKLAANQKEFTVQIEPAHLGKLLVKVIQSQEGTTISIMCNNSKTLEALAQNARQIGAIMEDNLGSPTAIYVEKGEENYLNQENNGGQGRQEDSEEQGRQQDSGKNEKEQNISFLQQLRLGLAPLLEA